MHIRPVPTAHPYADRPMQTDWLIDFKTLAETLSFSHAAQRRHVTQPAFSRRIRALEHWADTTLIDRTCRPPQLTSAGRLLLEKVPELTAAMQSTQAVLRGRAPSHREAIAFAAAPEIASGFFPGWITGLAHLLDRTSARMTVLEPQAALQHLLEGHCDLLLMHVSDDLPAGSAADRCEMLSLGHERLLPCSSPGAHLQTAFECNSKETLKAMALAGMGIALLPEHYVRYELEQGLLVPAGVAHDLVLEIRLVRRRANPGTKLQPLPSRFWNSLREHLALHAQPGPARTRRALPAVAEPT